MKDEEKARTENKGKKNEKTFSFSKRSGAWNWIKSVTEAIITQQFILIFNETYWKGYSKHLNV